MVSFMCLWRVQYSMAEPKRSGKTCKPAKRMIANDNNNVTVEIGLMACNRFMKRIREKVNFIEFRKNEEGTFYSILRSL